MVQFGKTLNDVVKSDWRCHAVAYMELKCALSQSRAAPGAGVNGGCHPDGVDGRVDPAAPGDRYDEPSHSAHTESSYCVSEDQKEKFFRIYEDSVGRLTGFYEERVLWAREERTALEKVVGRRVSEYEKVQLNDSNGVKMNEGLQAGESKEDAQSSTSTSFLIHRIANFSRDLVLVLEFMELNVTAFSKIMKKYDKRTGSNLREARLGELRAQHAYLFDGGELNECKNLCVEWIEQLQLISQRDSRILVGHLGGYLSLAAPTIASGDANTTAKPMQTEDAICENPQESSDMPENVHAVRDANGMGRESSVVLGAGDGKNGQRGIAAQSAPRSIHKIKDSQKLQNMIDRVNEELCLQRADSPFFDKTLEQNPPPSFTSSEVELAGELGQGEFCKIYEVRAFNVPESCHICFLHRGYNEPDPLIKATGVAITGAMTTDLPDTCHKVKGPRPASANEQPSIQLTQALATSRLEMTRPSLVKKVVSTFDYDRNISDYDELESDHEDDRYDYNMRGFMKDHCLRNGESRYAIKRIRNNLFGEDENTEAAIDLAREAGFLAALKHPNIIRIRGTINIPGHPKFSLILDRLYDTLEVQMKKWGANVKKHRGKFKGLIGKNKRMLNQIWTERSIAAYDLSHAMTYLHSCGILHRDIKPANIGFDVRGDLKLFDLGIAKELKQCEKEGQDQYHTSGMAGTRRYMAPEVAQMMPYGLSADVYSFGILMWEMFSLKTAFERHSREKHYKEVIVEGKRPKLSNSWPFTIKNLLKRCWHERPSQRPNFQAACQLIKFSLADFDHDGVNVSDRSINMLRKSERSIHGPAAFRESRRRCESEHGSHMKDSNILSDSLSQSMRFKNRALVPGSNHGIKVVTEEVSVKGYEFYSSSGAIDC